jgi:CheY-like chemotaxis protein
MAELDSKTRINLEKARVLLVDGPPGAADILVQVFYGFGVRQPTRCATADDAMRKLETEEFELIVCDGDLADGQAYDLVSRLRASTLEPNRYCPVILVRGHTPSVFVERARDCGANFVVTKPLRPMVLLERIMWVCMDTRVFVELESYVGPDRRFQNLGPPPGTDGRRKGDDEDVGKASTPNLDQSEIDRVLKPAKALL